MKKIFVIFLFVLLILSSCKLKEDTTGTDTGSDGTTTIKVTSPNGGETLSEGSSYDLTWTSTGTTLVKIQYSIDNGSTWSLVVDSLKNTGIYTWFPVPNQISSQCVIRISNIANSSIHDESDKPFSIIRNSKKNLSVSSPKKDEQWEAGSSQQIKWFSSGIDSVKLEYTTDSGNHWNLITVDKKIGDCISGIRFQIRHHFYLT